MNSFRTAGNRSTLELTLWNILLLSSGLVALFFIFTNGIPLVQAELMHPLKSKTRYVNLMIISVSVFFTLLAVIRWRGASFFDQLWIVKIAQKFFSFPLWVNLSILFVIYSATFSVVGFVRHAALETRAFDLGIFAQAVWNTLHGDFLYSSIKGGICLLGDHVSPILAFITPLYALWPDPRMLLILQALASGSSIFLIGYLAKDKLGSSFAGLIFALIYCFYQPPRGALHEDFHPEVLAEPFMIIAFIFLERKRLVWFLLSTLAFISAKESLLGISFMMGFYALVFNRWRIVGALIMILSVGLLWFDTRWVVPYFSGKPYLYQGFYHHLLTGPAIGWVKAIFNLEILSYVFKIFSPFLFLPFFSLPTLILTFPILAQNILSVNPVMRSLRYHYTVGLTPFVFISAIYGFQALSQKYEWISKRKTLIAVLLLAVGIIRSGPSEYYYNWQSMQHKTAHADLIREKLSVIPSQFSVLTHNNLIPQVTNRKYVYQFDYLEKPTKGEMAQKLNIDYVILEKGFWERETQVFAESLKELQGLGYQIEFEKDGFYILRKKI